MYTVLVLCPKLFNVKTKLYRKLDFFFKNLTDFQLAYLSDSKGLIQSYAKDRKVQILPIETYQDPRITHVIIFDDGEEFPQELSYFNAKNIPTRLVKIKITRVINIEKDNPKKYGSNYQYIGRLPNRPKGEPNWSNPYSLQDFPVDADEEMPTREGVIEKYAYGFERDNLPTNLKKSDTLQLMGKRLGCHCKPFACHGDVIADYLNSLDDGE